jgi:hypothetical protein
MVSAAETVRSLVVGRTGLESAVLHMDSARLVVVLDHRRVGPMAESRGRAHTCWTAQREMWTAEAGMVMLHALWVALRELAEWSLKVAVAR